MKICGCASCPVKVESEAKDEVEVNKTVDHKDQKIRSFLRSAIFGRVGHIARYCYHQMNKERKRGSNHWPGHSHNRGGFRGRQNFGNKNHGAYINSVDAQEESAGYMIEVSEVKREKSSESIVE